MAKQGIKKTVRTEPAPIPAPIIVPIPVREPVPVRVR